MRWRATSQAHIAVKTLRHDFLDFFPVRDLMCQGLGSGRMGYDHGGATSCWSVSAAFERNRVVYRVPTAEYRQTLDELTGLLDLEPLLEWPVRDLSPGERMKCEIAVALLHRPQVLFLDEPTIGLDVTMQRLRGRVQPRARHHGGAARSWGRPT